MTDIDYSFGQREELPGGRDNRTDYRLTARAQAVLELETDPPAGANEETPRRQLACRIRDISARGLSLYSPEPITIGALLPVAVSLGNHPEPFRLMMEVVWCRPNDSAFLVGGQIIDSDDTAYVEWLDAVAKALAEE